ncbi:MAG: hypothetical protein JW774_02530, partial [Candidatus Aureabacteria bacterium]|nr:hypothetical protein [Candidatus Auribacterota bacterium]
KGHFFVLFEVSNTFLFPTQHSKFIIHFFSASAGDSFTIKDMKSMKIILTGSGGSTGSYSTKNKQLAAIGPS